MSDIVYLAHRIPYPPNKGDKIRSYNLLRHLADHAPVHLGAFIDDPADWQYVDELKKFCTETCFLPLNPTLAKGRALLGLVRNTSLTMPYYRDSRLLEWLRSLVSARDVGCQIAFSSSMAQYLSDAGGRQRIVDFCDVDSEKWTEYSRMFVGPKRWVFRREGRRLLAEEAAIAARCDAAVFVSDEEAELFRERTGTDAARLHTVRNGVDTAYFDPGLHYDNPFADGDRAIVFVGAMDYWPNIDAVTWFADNVLPAVLTRNARARFHIVGSNPGAAVRSLARRPGIVVSGRVDDVRPYLRYAACSVAPLRVARGVQNKVLEAMAMARPIVATPEAVNGIAVNPEVVVRAKPADWADAVSLFVAAEASDRGVPASRERVASEYSWEAAARRLYDLTPAISH